MGARYGVRSLSLTFYSSTAKILSTNIKSKQAVEKLGCVTEWQLVCRREMENPSIKVMTKRSEKLRRESS